MSFQDSRARQLQVVIGAVEDGMLDSLTALRAVSQWLADESSSLCDVLLVQPELNDASKQTLRARFEEATRDSGQSAAMLGVQTLNDDQLRRLKSLLNESESASPLDASTVDFSLETSNNNFRSNTGTNAEATASYLPDSPGAINSSSKSTVLEHFQVLREFARGGLGVLYLAVDQRLQRQVIVKKIRPEHASSVVAREKFVLEAEVTGQLEHPGIVPIYALGTDGRSEPYYAMRLIGGQNLLAAIRDVHQQRNRTDRFYDGLRFRELLQRFIDVCHALHYAHARGVIHRDLKPANIMLGDHGETLVIDWGLAKAVSPSQDAQAPARAQDLSAPAIHLSGENDPTLPGSFAGTPRYAAPEQLDGRIDVLGPACDIYSLGAILVEILCNEPALDSKPPSAKAALEMIKRGAVRAPRDIDKRVPRPLNAICCKAMSFEMADRYSTAQALAEDLQRFLADECVLAYQHQETSLERLWRWTRHHRSWAAAMVLTLFGLALCASIANYFINRARLDELAARQQAVIFKGDALERYRAAKSAVDSLMDRSDQLQDIQGTEAYRAQLLQAAADNYAVLAENPSLDPELEIERARASVRLADALMLQNLTDRAFKQYDQVIQSLQTEQPRPNQLLNDSAVEWPRRIELGRALTRRGVARWQVQQLDEATADLNLAIELLQTIASATASDESTGNLAIAQLSLASLETERNRDVAASDLVREALKNFESLKTDGNRLFVLNRVKSHQLLGRLLRKQGEHVEATRQLALADSILTQLQQRHANDPELAETRAALWISAASQARHVGDLMASVESLEKALAAYDQLNQAWPGSTSYIYGMALSQLDMALVHLDLEEYSKALRYVEQAMGLFQSLDSKFDRDQLAIRLAECLDTRATIKLAELPLDGTVSAEIGTDFEQAIAFVAPVIQRAESDPTRLVLPALTWLAFIRI